MTFPELPIPAVQPTDAAALLRATIRDKRPVDTRPATLNFAFYGRVSTDDLRGLQDSEVSRAWQYGRATKLIEGHGTVVEEFFDEGVSRSTPFLRRPKGAELLELVANHRPNFHALVIGEAKRVFAGSQLEDVYYLLQRAGIELWIPEVSGRYDDNNITHKMILSFEGIMGKVESDTVRGRVRDSMTSIAVSADRRWLGGNPPYGYRLAVLERVEKRGVGTKGFTQTLELDPETAPIARRIFSEYMNGRSLREISAGLEKDMIPSPTGRPQWHIGTLSTILDNQTYTGYRVYGKQRKKQVPYDENDPRLGTVTTKTRLGDPPVLSNIPVYPPLITSEEFIRVDTMRQAKRTLTAPRKKASQRTQQSEPLRGRVFHNGKKLTLDRSRHGKVRYRSNTKDGSGKVSVYDWQLREAVHQWLSESFSRRNLPLLIKQLKSSAPKVQVAVRKLEAEQAKKRTQANNLLTLVEQGDNTATDRYQLRIAEIRELEAQILTLRAENLDVDGVVKLMRSLATETRKEVLDKASPEKLNRLYDALGIEIEYVPDEGGIRLNLAPLFEVGAKVGAPGGSLTLAPTRPSQLRFSVLLPLPMVA